MQVFSISFDFAESRFDAAMLLAILVLAGCSAEAEPMRPLGGQLNGDEALEALVIEGAEQRSFDEWGGPAEEVRFETWRTFMAPLDDRAGFTVDLGFVAQEDGVAPSILAIHPLGADNILELDLTTKASGVASFDVEIDPPNFGPDSPDYNVCLEYVYKGFSGGAAESPVYELCFYCDFVGDQDIYEASDQRRCRAERLHRSSIALYSSDVRAGQNLGVLVRKSTQRGPGIRESLTSDDPEVRYGIYNSDWTFADGPPPPTPYNPPRSSIHLFYDGLSSRFSYQTPPLRIYDAEIVLQEEEVTPVGTIVQPRITCYDAPEDDRCAICNTAEMPLILDVEIDDRGHPMDLAALCAANTGGGSTTPADGDTCDRFAAKYMECFPEEFMGEYAGEVLADIRDSCELYSSGEGECDQADYYACLSQLNCAEFETEEACPEPDC